MYAYPLPAYMHCCYILPISGIRKYIINNLWQFLKPAQVIHDNILIITEISLQILYESVRHTAPDKHMLAIRSVIPALCHVIY